MTTGKTIALTRRTLVTKVMSLLLNVLSGLVIREGNGTPLQYSCLENPMDGGAWKVAVHGVTEGWTRLSDFTFTFHFHALEKEMATNPRDGGAWWAAIHGVTKSRTQLSDFTFTFHFHAYGEGNGNPLQYSCLENSRDRGA